MEANASNLLLLGGENPTTWIVYNELVARYGSFPAFIEQPVSRWSLLKTRRRKLGLPSVLSQLAFASLIRPWLLAKSKTRISAIKREAGLESTKPVSTNIHYVKSINDESSIDLIGKFGAKIVVINGTRILSRKTLTALNATVINSHQGITPGYRGAHGAYWALAQSDPGHCGVTVHLVDEGIDTGNIVAQAIIKPEPQDNFVTYPYLQTAKALGLLAEAITAAKANVLKSVPISGASMVWYHPGFFRYIGNALRGVK